MNPTDESDTSVDPANSTPFGSGWKSLPRTAPTVAKNTTMKSQKPDESGRKNMESRPICTVNPILMNFSEKQPVPAGTIAVIQADLEEMPEGTILLAGQMLKRDLYPELSRLYSDTGGFYDFLLPDLQNRFIIGVSQDGLPIMGSGIIYYADWPRVVTPTRDIREMFRREDEA